MTALVRRLNAPVDGASLALFRLAFGALMVVAALRFFTHGWIGADYRAAHWFFPYWELSFIRPWPGVGMYVHYGVMALAALAVCVGFYYRAAALIFFLTFTYAHLCDKSNYLNHYYLISLVSFLISFMPLDRPERARAWMIWLLRFQFGVVYFFGGLGKLGSDWLLHAEPLHIWLLADSDLPVLRHIANRAWLAPLLSWGGLLFDLSVVPLLLWRRTRPFAYGAAIFFHVTTWLLFPIGMFPWVMLVGATLFFEPSWPRALGWRSPLRDNSDQNNARINRTSLALLMLYALLQILVPLRALLYPGNTLWTEEGFRFSWKVMLIEKVGALELTVIDAQGRTTRVSPRSYLTPLQTRMVATQPDMILDFAHLVAADFSRRGVGPVQVFAQAPVTFNGRRAAPLIDERVDLAVEHDGLAPKRWILPAPTADPIF